MKKISFSQSFRKDYRKLPRIIQDNLDRKLELLLENPGHPSLRFKKMGKTDYWEISITMNYRVILRLEGDEIKLMAAGTHDVLRKV